MKIIVIGLAALLLLGFLLWQPTRSTPPTPDPVVYPTVRISNDLERRVEALERQQQRERERQFAEQFAPRQQPDLILTPTRR